MMRFGIIGLGGMGRRHSQSLNRLGIPPYAGADPSEEARQKFSETYPSAKLFADWREMLKEPLDAVVVATPTYLHCEQVVASARKGFDVFCEKPMSLSVEEADRILQETRNVRFMMGFCRRFDNHWGSVRQLIISNTIGRPVLWRHCAGGAGPGLGREWFHDRNKGGGPLVDGAVHNYDFAHWCFGKPKRIVASMKHFRSDTSALDTGTASILFESEDEIMLSWSWGLPQGISAQSLIDVLGPYGAIFFSAPQELLPEGFDPRKQAAVRYLNPDGGGVHIFEKNDMAFDEIAHFVHCIERDETPVVGAEEGRVATQIACAVIESAETGKPVEL